MLNASLFDANLLEASLLDALPFASMGVALLAALVVFVFPARVFLVLSAIFVVLGALTNLGAQWVVPDHPWDQGGIRLAWWSMEPLFLRLDSGPGAWTALWGVLAAALTVIPLTTLALGPARDRDDAATTGAGILLTLALLQWLNLCRDRLLMAASMMAFSVLLACWWRRHASAWHQGWFVGYFAGDIFLLVGALTRQAHDHGMALPAVWPFEAMLAAPGLASAFWLAGVYLKVVVPPLDGLPAALAQWMVALSALLACGPAARELTNLLGVSGRLLPVVALLIPLTLSGFAMTLAATARGGWRWSLVGHLALVTLAITVTRDPVIGMAWALAHLMTVVLGVQMALHVPGRSVETASARTTDATLLWLAVWTVAGIAWLVDTWAAGRGAARLAIGAGVLTWVLLWLLHVGLQMSGFWEKATAPRRAPQFLALTLFLFGPALLVGGLRWVITPEKEGRLARVLASLARMPVGTELLPTPNFSWWKWAILLASAALMAWGLGRLIGATRGIAFQEGNDDWADAARALWRDLGAGVLTVAVSTLAFVEAALDFLVLLPGLLVRWLAYGCWATHQGLAPHALLSILLCLLVLVLALVGTG